MRTFLNHIKNETLDEIKTSLENLWQQMIQLSEFFQYSFVLILKRKCLVWASRVRSGESGTTSTIIYTRWSSRRYELGCDTPVLSIPAPLMEHFSVRLGGNAPWCLQWRVKCRWFVNAAILRSTFSHFLNHDRIGWTNSCSRRKGSLDCCGADIFFYLICS